MQLVLIFKMNFNKFLGIKILVLLIGSQLFFNFSKANAAEKIKVTYSIFSRTIKVSELNKFAKEGDSSKKLKRILRATGSPNEEIRSILNKEFEI